MRDLLNLFESIDPEHEEYFGHENCASFAYALWIAYGKETGATFDILSDPNGEAWDSDDEEGLNYEATHVIYSRPNNVMIDVRGIQTISEIQQHYYGDIVESFHPDEFWSIAVGMGDDKPLYGSKEIIEEALEVIRNNPSLYGLTETPQEQVLNEMIIRHRSDNPEAEMAEDDEDDMYVEGVGDMFGIKRLVNKWTGKQKRDTQKMWDETRALADELEVLQKKLVADENWPLYLKHVKDLRNGSNFAQEQCTALQKEWAVHFGTDISMVRGAIHGMPKEVFMESNLMELKTFAHDDLWMNPQPSDLARLVAQEDLRGLTLRTGETFVGIASHWTHYQIKRWLEEHEGFDIPPLAGTFSFFVTTPERFSDERHTRDCEWLGDRPRTDYSHPKGYEIVMGSGFDARECRSFERLIKGAKNNT